MSSQGFGNSKPGSRTADASEVIRNMRIMAQAAADRTYSNNPKRNFNRSSAAILATYAAASSATGLTYATRSGSTPSTVESDDFNYPDFSSTVGLRQVSTAGVIDNAIYLTQTAFGDVGNVYRSTAIPYNRSFSFEWNFECSGGTSPPADGFCLQWTPTNNTNGGAGGACGYVTTAIQALFFKTVGNDAFFWFNNNVQISTTAGQDFYRNLFFWADYSHGASTMNIYISTTNTKPDSPTFSLSGFTFDSSSYYLGFGGATGAATQNHILRSMKLTIGEPVAPVCGGNSDSASFPGTTTSRLTIPDDADLRMGTSDFTIEWFQYWTGQSSFARPFSKGTYNEEDNDIAVSYEGTFYVWVNGNAQIIQNSDPNVNIWEHVALVRSGNTFSVYLNGSRIGTRDFTGVSFNGTADLTIGNETVPNADASFSGKITSFRWTKGSALYSGATLTVPTAPLAALPGTKLLIQGITDTSCMGKTVTSTNVTVSTDTPF